MLRPRSNRMRCPRCPSYTSLFEKVEVVNLIIDGGLVSANMTLIRECECGNPLRFVANRATAWINQDKAVGSIVELVRTSTRCWSQKDLCWLREHVGGYAEYKIIRDGSIISTGELSISSSKEDMHYYLGHDLVTCYLDGQDTFHTRVNGKWLDFTIDERILRDKGIDEKFFWQMQGSDIIRAEDIFAQKPC